MSWKTSRHGNAWMKQDNLVANVRFDPEAEAYRLSLKLEYLFTDPDEARAMGEDMLSTLEEAGLSIVE